MGTWGYKNFENDTAQDFLEDLTDTSNMKLIRKVFNEAIPSSVIKWYNRGIGIFRKKISFKNNELKKAAYAVEKIMTNSELKALWKESDEFSMWQKNNEQLVNRLLSQI